LCVYATITVSASTGEWAFSDQRNADWAKCYRLEYNRPFTVDGKREGWLQVAITAKRPEPITVPLTTGEAVSLRGIPFSIGPPAAVDQSLAGMLMLHAADGEAARGAVVGEVLVTYADGQDARVALVWETSLTSRSDDPRDLPGGALVSLPDDTLAWITSWRNPRPDEAIQTVEPVTRAAGWRLLAATGVRADADERRIATALRAGQSAGALAEETVVSLDGTWRFQPEGGDEQDISVPQQWNFIDGLRNVHRGTYRRTFDVPDSMQGQRVLLRFETVGDYCEVTVNGFHVGEHLGPCVPFEIDVTERAAPGSTGNALEVAVRDDTHFSVPKETTDWRDRRHWIPHGIGANSRKGIWQSVNLVGRPPVHISNVRVQTSVRGKKLTVIYELFNSGRATFTGELAASVRPWEGGDVEVELPATPVELPGYVTTTLTVEAPWESPGLWQPDHPTLYALRSALSDDDGERAHRADTRFGFREGWFEGIHFYLNGIRYNLRGESPSYNGNADLMDTRAAAEGMVSRALAANFNVLRFHAVPAPRDVYDVCDEMGMLVVDESGIYASWQMLMPEHPRWMPECERHLSAWVRRDRNHPSIVLWSAENEGLNVGVLTPGQLAEYKRVIDANDGTRPVIFCGDGTGYGVAEASSKHYVRLISDLEDRGGRSSGYGRDLRDDIYWAAEYKQDIPLGVSEFLFPANDEMRAKHREVCAMMGLQTRGYRYADWFDIRPYNPFYTGYQSDEGVREGYEGIWDTIVKSFAPIAVFDKAYDALGPFPEPPALRVGEAARRALIVYNDALADESVTVTWQAVIGGEKIAGEERQLTIELGYHAEIEIEFTPEVAGELELRLTSSKGGVEQFADARRFVVQ
ncbi:MAG TPA: glycoside hydrolase family 2 TIM barrel-domain containing protein, partial [Armatimonadota bacterium]|nr:glycoside hydrolase family 2 TIM barrel-domain containing protein [Armatimonadota bacterium]